MLFKVLTIALNDLSWFAAKEMDRSRETNVINTPPSAVWEPGSPLIAGPYLIDEGILFIQMVGYPLARGCNCQFLSGLKDNYKKGFS